LALSFILYWDQPLFADSEVNTEEMSAEASPVTLTLKSGPIQAAKKIYLSDIVTCQGDNKICDEAYGVEVPLQGKSGQEQVLSADKIKEITKLEWPNRKVLFVGPKAIKIIPPSTRLSESKIRNSLIEILKIPQDDGQFIVNIEKLQIPSTVSLPDEGSTLIFPDLSEANLRNPDWVRKNLSGNQRLKITWLSDDFEETKQPPTYSLVASFRLEEMVPVSTRDIHKGDIIREHDVTLAPYECGKSARHVILETSAIIGKKAKTTISSGQPFSSGSIENIRVISRGQSAQLIIRRDDLVVLSKIQALDSGSYGDVIDAFYPATKKKLRVRIVDHSTVESVN
jgi:flagella basal body P-ring formation protein FlgA